MRLSITAATAFVVLILNSPSTIYADGIPPNDFTSKIEHVILLMLENRSFDHIAGYFDIPGLNGLTGNEKNHLIPQDPSSLALTPKKGAQYRLKSDPDHTAAAGTLSIFGVEKEPIIYPDVAPMNGFVADAAEGWFTTKKKDLEDAMLAFDPEHIPVTYELAKQYAIFDAWFSSVPGPTHPNRMYTFTGTSNGVDINDDIGAYMLGYPQRPFFANLDDAKIDWTVYFHDVPEILMLRWMRNVWRWNHLKKMDLFKQHAKEGTLPPFSLIEPKYFGRSENDNHPPSDSRKAEALLKDVYETVRASPKWNSTLLIITYDENGGIYDHVSPPMKDVPNPDGKKGKYIKFDRLGVRVPTIMVSPWIKPSVIHRPSKNQRPFPSSEFDHTSIIATLKKVWGLPNFLTKRDAWAGTFEDILSNERRDDCPEFMPPAPKIPKTNWFGLEEEATPMQKDLLTMLEGMKGSAKTRVPEKAALMKFAHWGKSVLEKVISKWTPEQRESKAEELMDDIRRSTFSETPSKHSEVNYDLDEDIPTEEDIFVDALQSVEEEGDLALTDDSNEMKNFANVEDRHEIVLGLPIVTPTEALECLLNIETFFLQQDCNQDSNLDMVERLKHAEGDLALANDTNKRKNLANVKDRREIVLGLPIVTPTEALECLLNIETFFLQQDGNQARNLVLVERLKKVIAVRLSDR